MHFICDTSMCARRLEICTYIPYTHILFIMLVLILLVSVYTHPICNSLILDNIETSRLKFPHFSTILFLELFNHSRNLQTMVLTVIWSPSIILSFQLKLLLFVSPLRFHSEKKINFGLLWMDSEWNVVLHFIYSQVTVDYKVLVSSRSFK